MGARRSTHAQIEAMRKWAFSAERQGSGLVVWRGTLRPRAKPYSIMIFWWPKKFDRPYVVICEPKIKPIAGKTFCQIPHLIYNAEKPELSGLCLFDPDGNEWSDASLIADTTVRWTSEWLLYYELWHLLGEWLGPSVGYETAAEMWAADTQPLHEALDIVH